MEAVSCPRGGLRLSRTRGPPPQGFTLGYDVARLQRARPSPFPRTPRPTLAATLDALVADPNADVYRLLFGSDTS